MSNHTPLPWHKIDGVIIGDYQWIAQMELTAPDKIQEDIQEANAALIVEAVNNYAALRAELDAVKLVLSSVTSDLRAEVEDRYGIPPIHPALMPKYNRDIYPVLEAEKLLSTQEAIES